MTAPINPQCKRCGTVTVRIKTRIPKAKTWMTLVLYRCPKCKRYHLEDETYDEAYER